MPDPATAAPTLGATRKVTGAGMLDRCTATTHDAAFDELAAISPSTEVLRDRRYV